MKKMLKLLSAMAVLVCGLMMTGCLLNDDEKEILGPNNVWCEYKSRNTDDDINTEDKGKYYFKYVDATKTFSVAYFPAEDSTIQKFNAAVTSGKIGYYLKEYKANEEGTDSDGEDTKLGFKMDQDKWIVLYRFYLKKSSLPAGSEAIDLGNKYAEIQSYVKDLSWKSIFRNKIISFLEENL